MRFFIGFLVTVGLIVLIIILLIRGGGGSATNVPKVLNLGDYATSTTAAQLIIDSPIVAEPNHKEIKIVVTQNDVTFTEYQGYEATVIRTQSFPNNQVAYAVFLHALQNNGFNLGVNDPALHDERGYCADGSRYIYSFADNNADKFRTWSTSCGGQGTFKGVPSEVRALFRLQVPGYDTLTSDFNT
jgi:hypothetical protein